MTRLSISMTAALLTMTLAPAASAYGTDPAPDTLRNISHVSLVNAQVEASAGTCKVTVTPAMAEMLGRPDNWRIGDEATLTAVACNGDQ